MKLFKRFGIMLIVLLLVVASLPLMVNAETKTVKPGGSVTVSFAYNVYGIDGQWSISNSAFTMTASNKGKVCDYSDSDERKSSSTSVTIAAPSTAKDGDSCTVSFKYIMWDTTGDNIEKQGTYTCTVKVSVPQTSSDTTKTPDTTKSTPDTTKPTTTKPTTTKPTTTKPASTTKTTTSSTAKSTTNAAETTKPTETTSSGETTIASSETTASVEDLHKQLQEVIDSGNAKINDSEIGGLYLDLAQAIKEAEELMESGDTDVLKDKISEIQTILDKIDELEKKTDQKIKEIEKTTYPEYPEEPYCNIPIHKLWPILFFISLFINIVLIIFIIIYVKKRKDKEEEDETPVVDYNIVDDDK